MELNPEARRVVAVWEVWGPFPINASAQPLHATAEPVKGLAPARDVTRGRCTVPGDVVIYEHIESDSCRRVITLSGMSSR